MSRKILEIAQADIVSISLLKNERGYPVNSVWRVTTKNDGDFRVTGNTLFTSYILHEASATLCLDMDKDKLDYY